MASDSIDLPMGPAMRRVSIGISAGVAQLAAQPPVKKAKQQPQLQPLQLKGLDRLIGGIINVPKTADGAFEELVTALADRAGVPSAVPRSALTVMYLTPAGTFEEIDDDQLASHILQTSHGVGDDRTLYFYLKPGGEEMEELEADPRFKPVVHIMQVEQETARAVKIAAAGGGVVGAHAQGAGVDDEAKKTQSADNIADKYAVTVFFNGNPEAYFKAYKELGLNIRYARSITRTARMLLEKITPGQLRWISQLAMDKMDYLYKMVTKKLDPKTMPNSILKRFEFDVRYIDQHVIKRLQTYFPQQKVLETMYNTNRGLIAMAIKNRALQAPDKENTEQEQQEAPAAPIKKRHKELEGGDTCPALIAQPLEGNAGRSRRVRK